MNDCLLILSSVLTSTATIVIAVWAIKNHNLAKAIKLSSDSDKEKFVNVLKSLTRSQLSIVSMPGQSVESNVNHFIELKEKYEDKLFK